MCQWQENTPFSKCSLCTRNYSALVHVSFVNVNWQEDLLPFALRVVPVAAAATSTPCKPIEQMKTKMTVSAFRH